MHRLRGGVQSNSDMTSGRVATKTPNAQPTPPINASQSRYGERKHWLRRPERPTSNGGREAYLGFYRTDTARGECSHDEGIECETTLPQPLRRCVRTARMSWRLKAISICTFRLPSQRPLTQ